MLQVELNGNLFAQVIFKRKRRTCNSDVPMLYVNDDIVGNVHLHSFALFARLSLSSLLDVSHLCNCYLLKLGFSTFNM